MRISMFFVTGMILTQLCGPAGKLKVEASISVSFCFVLFRVVRVFRGYLPEFLHHRFAYRQEDNHETH
jgi:hypothetical protein